MSGVFLVPAKGREEVLTWNVAGLSLAERLYHHAKRAGLKPIFLVSPGKFSDLSIPKGAIFSDLKSLPEGAEDVVVVCSPGTLPSTECLKWLASYELPENKFLELDGLLVCKMDYLQQLFALQVPGDFDAFREALSRAFEPVKLACDTGTIYQIKSPEDIKAVEKKLFWGLVKDTEGFMSRHFERRISLFISRRLVNTRITPNEITVISILIGLLGAYFISLGQGFWQITGAILFLVHSIVDGCDGEIARIKFKESRFGGILDFWGDNIVHAAVFSAIGIEWARRTGDSLPLYLSAAAVFGTFLSASIVYFSTMRKKKEGPLYTSVSGGKKSNKIVKVADFLSRRDFIYLVVILAFMHHLDWFLIAASVGSLIFAGVLVGIRLRD